MAGPTLSRCLASLAAVLAALSVAAQPGEAQISRAIKSRIKQSVEQRKQQTEDHLVARAAEPVDSAVERLMSPVDSAAGWAGSTAGETVSQVGRGPDASAREEIRIRRDLTRGPAHLPEVRFESDTDLLTAGSSATLQALARVLSGETAVFLIQGRADPGTALADQQATAELRAVAVKSWLTGVGVPPEQIFATGDGVAGAGEALVSVVRAK